MSAILSRKDAARRQYDIQHSRRNRRRDFSHGEGKSGEYHDNLAYNAFCRANRDAAALRHYLRTWHLDTTDGYVPGDEHLLASWDYDIGRYIDDDLYDPDHARAQLERLAAIEECYWCDQAEDPLSDTYWEEYELERTRALTSNSLGYDPDYDTHDPDRIDWTVDDLHKAVGYPA